MLTKFGKAMRKYRIDYMYTLATIAKELSISVPYVSAIENGKRPVPVEKLDILVKLFHLAKEDENEFRSLASLQAENIKIDLSNSTDKQKELAFAFARKINSLSEGKIAKIKMLFNEKKTKR